MTVKYDTKTRHVAYREGTLYVEDVSIHSIVAEHGTPTYVYSMQTIQDAFRGYQKGLEGLPHLIAFAVKANGSLAILNRLAKEGAGADLTSGGELLLAQKAGMQSNRMVYSGVGKTDAEIIAALDADILLFNVESEPELERIAQLAEQKGKVAPIAIRVNPDIDPHTHPKISTGLKKSKFGIPVDQAKILFERAAAHPSLNVRGIAAHIGSSLMNTTPLLDTLNLLLQFREEVQSRGIEIPYLDMGGGLGIQYKEEKPESPTDYASKLKQRLLDAGVTLIIEPGRSITGNAGLLLCQVTFVKETGDKTFVVVDAGMNSLIRPAIYEAFHDIIPGQIRNGSTQSVYVVGPICESSDVFGRNRPLPPCQRGDILAICSAGAYGYSMASYYNGQLRPAEVLVEGGSQKLIRQRDTYDDLLRGQILMD